MAVIASSCLPAVAEAMLSIVTLVVAMVIGVAVAEVLGLRIVVIGLRSMWMSCLVTVLIAAASIVAVVAIEQQQ